jgi:hypothetical protein
MPLKPELVFEDISQDHARKTVNYCFVLFILVIITLSFYLFGILFFYLSFLLFILIIWHVKWNS